MSDNFKINDSHLFLSSSAEIDAISRPLKEHFGVTSLVYQCNDNDGSEIRLSNQPRWIKYYYDHAYYLNSGFEKNPRYYQSGFVVWSHLSHHQPILNAAREHQIDHGMTLIQKTANGCEFYFLGTTPDKPHVTNLLLNNLQFLQRFSAYFKEQAAPLLKKAYFSRITIPKKFEIISSDEQGIPYKNSPLNINKIFNVKKIYVDHRTALSKRELDCAKLLLQGQSARLIAEQLFISQRTVETHLKNMKEKFNCHSKSELIGKLIESNVIHI